MQSQPLDGPEDKILLYHSYNQRYTNSLLADSGSRTWHFFITATCRYYLRFCGLPKSLQKYIFLFMENCFTKYLSLTSFHLPPLSYTRRCILSLDILALGTGSVFRFRPRSRLLCPGNQSPRLQCCRTSVSGLHVLDTPLSHSLYLAWVNRPCVMTIRICLKLGYLH